METHGVYHTVSNQSCAHRRLAAGLSPISCLHVRYAVGMPAAEDLLSSIQSLAAFELGLVIHEISDVDPNQ